MTISAKSRGSFSKAKIKTDIANPSQAPLEKVKTRHSVSMHTTEAKMNLCRNLSDARKAPASSGIERPRYSPRTFGFSRVA